MLYVKSENRVPELSPEHPANRPGVVCRAKPTSECKQSAYVIFCSTRYGSHCAHLRSWWPYKYSWLDCVVPEFFGAVLAQKEGGQKELPQVQHASLSRPLHC